jgi:hypothetical protein
LEVCHLAPFIAKYVRDCLRDFILKKSVPDCRTKPSAEPALGFNQNIPSLIDDDWDANPVGLEPRQAHAVQVHCFTDAAFLVFQIDPKNDLYKAFRLDPRICHELTDRIDQAEPYFVDVMTASAPTRTRQ